MVRQGTCSQIAAAVLEATKDVQRNALMCRTQRVRQVHKLLTGLVDQQLPKVHALVTQLAEKMFRLLGKAAPCGVGSSWRPLTYDDFVDAQCREGKGDGNRISAQKFEVKLMHYTNSGDICKLHRTG